jgi:arylsulfatase A-like enzyme
MLRRILGSLVVVTVMLAAGYLYRSALLDEVRQPNVIIYLVDTLRADHLGVFGYERDTSPVLDRWAREAVIFDQAYSPTSWTKSATVSLLTGLDPLSHRVEGRLDVIPAEVRLLSEQLKAQKYSTYAAVTNPNVLPLWGFDRGFDVYDDLASEERSTSADVVLDRFAEWLPGLAEAQPFFLYMHLLDPHKPYDPPAPFDTRFAAATNSRIDRVVSAYDGEIAYGDSQFRRLLDSLRAHDLYADTMIVFVSDHGEEMMEHGEIGHGRTLFQEVIRVPLLIKFPNGAHAGKRVRAPVSLIDMLPTIMSVLKQPPLPDLDGRDLTTLLGLHESHESREGSWSERDLFLSLDLVGTDDRTHVVRGILSESQKFLRRVRPTRGEALFHLERDPVERKNLAGMQSEARAELAARLDARLAERSRGVHLRILNDLDAGPVGCRAVLHTIGRFTEASGSHLEDGDQVELSEDGQTLTLECQLQNRPHPTGGVPPVIADVDGLVFQVTPTNAPIFVLDLSTNDDRDLPLKVGSERRLETLPFSFDATSQEWAIRDVQELLREGGMPANRTAMGAYLGVIAPPPALDAVPEALHDRLRALGYLGEDPES